MMSYFCSFQNINENSCNRLCSIPHLKHHSARAHVKSKGLTALDSDMRHEIGLYSEVAISKIRQGDDGISYNRHATSGHLVKGPLNGRGST